MPDGKEVCCKVLELPLWKAGDNPSVAELLDMTFVEDIPCSSPSCLKNEQLAQSTKVIKALPM
jgi:hypothetical protein